MANERADVAAHERDRDRRDERMTEQQTCDNGVATKTEDEAKWRARDERQPNGLLRQKRECRLRLHFPGQRDDDVPYRGSHHEAQHLGCVHVRDFCPVGQTRRVEVVKPRIEDFIHDAKRRRMTPVLLRAAQDGPVGLDLRRRPLQHEAGRHRYCDDGRQQQPWSHHQCGDADAADDADRAQGGATHANRLERDAGRHNGRQGDQTCRPTGAARNSQRQCHARRREQEEQGIFERGDRPCEQARKKQKQAEADKRRHPPKRRANGAEQHDAPAQVERDP